MTWLNAVGLSDASAGGYFIAYVSYVLWALSFVGLAEIFCCLRSLAILQFRLKPLPRLTRHSNGLFL